MTNPTTNEIEEFRVSIPQADLDDLADRVIDGQQAAELVALARGHADSHCPYIDVSLAPRCLGKGTPVDRNRSRAGTPPHHFWISLYILCTV